MPSDNIIDDKCPCGKPGTHWWEGAQRGGYHCDEHHAEFERDNEQAREVDAVLKEAAAKRAKAITEARAALEVK